MSKKITQEEFVARVCKLHGDKYDYSKAVYRGKDEKVCIICPEHGEFWQTPHNHWNGQNCPLCAIKKKASSTEAFIERAKKVHGDKYDYSKVEYVDAKTKVCIICPIHGEFWQRPDIHLRGSVCRRCANDDKANTLEYYIELSKGIHGDKYDFSHAVYLGSRHDIEICCKECGNVFRLPPTSLIKGQGCRMCKIEEHRRIDCLEGELWRDVKDFHGYQVSNFGRVRSIDRTIVAGGQKREVVGLILKTIKDKDGYDTVSFKMYDGDRGHKKRVHRLVAEAFIDNPNSYPCVDHINGIRDDNRVENLRWCTAKMNANFELAKKNRSEAIKQSYVNNPDLRTIRANTFGKSNMRRIEVFENGNSLGVFESQTQASAFLGISQSLISSCMRNGTTSKKGITVKNI